MRPRYRSFSFQVTIIKFFCHLKKKKHIQRLIYTILEGMIIILLNNDKKRGNAKNNVFPTPFHYIPASSNLSTAYILPPVILDSSFR